MSKKINLIIVNGPNLNLLGTREPDIYGKITLDDIQDLVLSHAEKCNVNIDFFQSNSESELIDYIQNNRDADGIIINPAAYTHTSIALRDTISAVSIPAIEIHLSNIHSREEFRSKSFIAPVCIGQISGFGYNSYILGIDALITYLKQQH